MSTVKTETLSTPSNATVPVDTVVNGTAKAWVNFNGTGTVAIRRAFNVASITDNGTGNYTVNFTTAMVDADYSVGSCVAVDYSNTGNRTLNLANAAPTTSACRISTLTAGGSNTDCLFVAIQIFR